ncbi:60S ribosomal protein L27-3-like [Durio zibethinus]|uniref:60S ribosomal protein L27-3-like n=1 Tax=Durio zibethinus TaxID=66656 RepID=A0A6P5YW01_DURZI|nr:60S ribosomal protein L27-3-like [Durio zibethinus]
MVVVKSFNEGMRDRPYGHCLVTGIKEYASKVIRKDSTKKIAKKSRVSCFIKLMNYEHLIPTCYFLDVDLKDMVTVDALQTKDKKMAACNATKERSKKTLKIGKNR